MSLNAYIVNDCLAEHDEQRVTSRSLRLSLCASFGEIDLVTEFFPAFNVIDYVWFLSMVFTRQNFHGEEISFQFC